MPDRAFHARRSPAGWLPISAAADRPVHSREGPGGSAGTSGRRRCTSTCAPSRARPASDRVDVAIRTVAVVMDRLSAGSLPPLAEISLLVIHERLGDVGPPASARGLAARAGARGGDPVGATIWQGSCSAGSGGLPGDRARGAWRVGPAPRPGCSDDLDHAEQAELDRPDPRARLRAARPACRSWLGELGSRPTCIEWSDRHRPPGPAGSCWPAGCRSGRGCGPSHPAGAARLDARPEGWSGLVAADSES